MSCAAVVDLSTTKFKFLYERMSATISYLEYSCLSTPCCQHCVGGLQEGVFIEWCDEERGGVVVGGRRRFCEEKLRNVISGFFYRPHLKNQKGLSAAAVISLHILSIINSIHCKIITFIHLLTAIADAPWDAAESSFTKENYKATTPKCNLEYPLIKF